MSFSWIDVDIEMAQFGFKILLLPETAYAVLFQGMHRLKQYSSLSVFFLLDKFPLIHQLGISR